ncbi:hypothetical protein [Dongshaea marina]|uniref:hypothetical protein n=1 Tax=Dongshaea marina TaxID=2047966 RepID=UPI000D3E4C70|nr:hypothetical protein [Dongshaea marina]
MTYPINPKQLLNQLIIPTLDQLGLNGELAQQQVLSRVLQFVEPQPDSEQAPCWVLPGSVLKLMTGFGIAICLSIPS